MTHIKSMAARPLHLLRQRLSILLLALLVTLAQTPAEAETLARADHSEITYHLQRAPAARRSGVLLMLQGSGCEPVAARPWLRSDPPLIAPGYAVLSVEKYGVRPDQAQNSFIDDCALDCWAKNTLQQRVLDVLQVIGKLRQERWWNRRLIIYGGSEGGAVAALLAPLIEETRAVIIVSSGVGVPVGELIRAAVPPPVSLQIPAILAEAKANPTGAKRFGGTSYRWWADAADVTPAKVLLQTDAPVLLIQGGRDQFAPVATARAARSLFAAAGKRNLTYREYSAYDHFMKDAAGDDHTSAVLRYVRDWLKRL
jgi:pimeloyl-ACP methyl ester carboxylesterase